MPRVKSKYAEKQPKNAVRIADEGGVQQGRVPPSQRVYGKTRYKTATLAEASANMRARQEGSMAPIANGLDFDGLPDEVAADMRVAKGRGRAKVAKVEAPAVLDRGNAYDPFSGEEDPQNQIVDDRPAAPAAVQRVQQPARLIPVTMEMDAGSMGLQAQEILQCKYAVTIVLPLKSEGATFIPKPGSEMVLGFEETQVRCFFPGAHFKSEALGVIFLVFIKADV